MELEVDARGAKLLYLEDVEVAQRRVTLDLLEARIDAKTACARTKMLTALADRIRDSERALYDRPVESDESDGE
jgi:hypothetical protein